jgi:hypothetical protein
MVAGDGIMSTSAFRQRSRRGSRRPPPCGPVICAIATIALFVGCGLSDLGTGPGADAGAVDATTGGVDATVDVDGGAPDTLIASEGGEATVPDASDGASETSPGDAADAHDSGDAADVEDGPHGDAEDGATDGSQVDTGPLPCAPTCSSAGAACTGGGMSCLSGVCSGNVCQPGGTGTPCASTNGNCLSNVCSGILTTTCQAGGATEPCVVNGDCLSGVCAGKVCQPGGTGTPCASTNGNCLSNDCSGLGNTCNLGEDTTPCRSAADCGSQSCGGNVCQPPSCALGGNKCPLASDCGSDGDCQGGSCVFFKCN